MKRLLILLAALCLAPSAFGVNVAPRPNYKFDIRYYGAIGTDAVNDQTALENALTAAAMVNGVVFVPHGLFLHDSVLVIPDSVTMMGTGELRSTDTTSTSPQHAIILAGDKSELRDVIVSTTWAGTRQSNNNGSAVVAAGASNFVIDNITVSGAATVGVMISNSHNGRVTNSTVTNTLNDGIHHTNLSSGILTSGNKVTGHGDDGIAVVSYVSQGGVVHDVVISENIVRDGDGSSRGLTVVGGDHISLSNNTVTNVSYAGLYIASEASFNTYGSTNITGTNNNLDSTGSLSPAVYASVQIYGRAVRPSGNIKLEGGSVTNCRHVGLIISNTSEAVDSATYNVQVKSVYFKGAPGNTGFGADCAGGTDISLLFNTFEHFASYGVVAEAGEGSGDLRIIGNTFRDVDTVETGNEDIIGIYNSTYSAAYIMLNGAYEINDSTERFLEANVDSIPTIYFYSNEMGGLPSLPTQSVLPDTLSSFQLYSVLTDETGSGTAALAMFSKGPAFNLRTSINPAPTTHGDINWDSTDDMIVIGNGGGASRFPDSDKIEAMIGVGGTGWNWSDSSSHGPDSVLFADSANHADSATGAARATRALQLAEAYTSPGDTALWHGDTLHVNSSNDTTWVRSNDVFVGIYDQVGEGSGAVIVGSDTLRADDSGLTYLGLATRPWGLMYQTQLYLLETTGTDSWIPVNRVGPSTGQVMEFDGTSWGPGTDGGGGGVVSADTSGDGTLDVSIPDSVGLYQGLGVDLSYNATGRKLTFGGPWTEVNSGADTSLKWTVAASEADTALIIEKVDDSNIVRLYPGDLSATKKLHVYAENGLVLGDTVNGGALKVRAELQTFLDTGGGYYYTPWDTSESTVPATGDVHAWDGTKWEIQAQTGGGGEATSAINRGTEADSVFYQESGNELQFRRLKDSTGVIITPSGDTALSFSVDTNAANIRALVIEHIDDSLNEYALTTAVELLIEDSLDEYATTTAVQALIEDSLNEYLPDADFDDSLANHTELMLDAHFDDSAAPWAYWNVAVWRYDATDGDADPGDFEFRTGDGAAGNNPYTADTLYIDSLDMFGHRMDTVIHALDKGWLLRAMSYRNRVKHVTYRAEAASVDASGYWKLRVHAVDTGATALAANDTITFELVPDPRFLIDDSLNAYLLASLFDDSITATTAKIPTAATADSADNISDGAVDATDKVAANAIEEPDLNVTNAGSDGQVLSKASNQFTWIDAGAGGTDTVAIGIDENGGTMARPMLDVYDNTGTVDTLAWLPDNATGLFWTDSIGAFRGKQGTYVGDSTSTNPFRVVVNSVEAQFSTEDSTGFDSAFSAGRVSTDSVQLGEGWIAQADGAGMTITSGVLNNIGDSTITVSADAMTVANIPDGSVDSNKIVNATVVEDDISMPQWLRVWNWMGEYNATTDSVWLSLPFHKGGDGETDTVWSFQDSSMMASNDILVDVLALEKVPPGVTAIDSIHLAYQTSSATTSVVKIDSIVVYNQAVAANSLTRVGVYALSGVASTSLAVIDNGTDITGLVQDEQLAFRFWGTLDANTWFRVNLWVRLKH